MQPSTPVWEQGSVLAGCCEKSFHCSVSRSALKPLTPTPAPAPLHNSRWCCKLRTPKYKGTIGEPGREGKQAELHGVELLRGFPQRLALFLFPIFQNPLLASAGFQAPAFLNQIAEFKPSPQHFPVV